MTRMNIAQNVDWAEQIAGGTAHGDRFCVTDGFHEIHLPFIKWHFQHDESETRREQEITNRKEKANTVWKPLKKERL